MPQQLVSKENHKQRSDLTGEHPAGDAGQIILAFLFAAIWLSDTFLFRYTTFLNQSVPNYIRTPVGFMLLIVSFYLTRNGLSIVFGEQREKPGVIRKGVFNLVRHPVYLGEIVLYLGMLALSISLAAALVWLIAIGFLHYISRYEERLLLERFGRGVRAVPASGADVDPQDLEEMTRDQTRKS